MRRKIFSDKDNGFWRCRPWTRKTMSLLSADGLERFFSPIEASKRKLFVSPDYTLSVHSWIQTISQGERFIADGTAGQLDRNYPLGFYGFVLNCPENLRRIYELNSK